MEGLISNDHSSRSDSVRDLQPFDQWKLKASTAHLLVCAVCGRNTRWGRNVGDVMLCDEHWTFRNRWRIRFDRK